MIASTDVVLMTTAWRRPGYLETSLASWGRVRGVGTFAHLVVALADSPVRDEMVEAVGYGAHVMGLDFTVLPDSPAAAAQYGMHWAVGEALTWIRRTLRPRAVILTEEDIEVSADAGSISCGP